MDFFADKTIFIAGAATDLVWRLLPQLENASARVILLDRDEDELLSMARRSPALVEPLPVERLDVATAQLVGKIWSDEPIDIFLDALALSETADHGSTPAISAALLTAFEPALMAADGCAVSVVPKSGPTASVQAQMAEASCLQLAVTMAEKWERWRVTLNVLRPEPGTSATDMATAFEVAARAGWGNLTGVHIPIRATSV